MPVEELTTADDPAADIPLLTRQSESETIADQEDRFRSFCEDNTPEADTVVGCGSVDEKECAFLALIVIVVSVVEEQD